ncbi:hypothetical protein PN36_15575 [Candidatus Thiomargarita nelsonii]|uniref:Uncharacterized protein n=1 Tax=Candidatus Thiomargarita nelsonii TaxID=1003181 RepID=A0A4E0QJA6_9GAMM|nr:hypothetical protein PN36_35510 [Candidatus Thiomargarita nelsonii]TGO02945.1 hypothetical protein PN36_15575 [Candidatus Thiomargarita nelsonii]
MTNIQQTQFNCNPPRPKKYQASCERISNRQRKRQKAIEREAKIQEIAAKKQDIENAQVQLIECEIELLEAQNAKDRIPEEDMHARLKSQLLIDQARVKVSMAKVELCDLKADLKAIKPIARSSKRQTRSKRLIAKRQARINRLRAQRRKRRKAAEREADKQVIAAKKIEIDKAKDVVDACQLDVFAAKNALDGIPKTEQVAQQKGQAVIYQAQAALATAKAEFCQLQDDFKPIAPPLLLLPAPAPKYQKPVETIQTPEVIYLGGEIAPVRRPIGKVIEPSLAEPLSHFLQNLENAEAMSVLERAIYVQFAQLWPNLPPYEDSDLKCKVTASQCCVTFTLFHAFGEPNDPLFFLFCARIQFEDGKWRLKNRGHYTFNSLDQVNLMLDSWCNPEFDWDFHLGKKESVN